MSLQVLSTLGGIDAVPKSSILAETWQSGLERTCTLEMFSSCRPEKWAAHSTPHISQLTKIEHRFGQLKEFSFGDMIEGYVCFCPGQTLRFKYKHVRTETFNNCSTSEFKKIFIWSWDVWKTKWQVARKQCRFTSYIYLYPFPIWGLQSAYPSTAG